MYTGNYNCKLHGGFTPGMKTATVSSTLQHTHVYIVLQSRLEKQTLTNRQTSNLIHIINIRNCQHQISNLSHCFFSLFKTQDYRQVSHMKTFDKSTFFFQSMPKDR